MSELNDLKRSIVSFIRYEFAGGSFDEDTDEQIIQYVLNFKDDNEEKVND